MITFDAVTIRVSELQTTTVVVAPWETPILLAIYGEEAQVTGSEEVDREPPEPNDEFARLANRYGPKNEDTPVVAAVYGSFGPGVRAIERAINDASGVNTIANGLEAADALQVPTLTDAQIDAIIAKDAQGHNAAQAAIVPAPALVPAPAVVPEAPTEILPSVEPKPPIVTAPVVVPEGNEGEDAGDAGLAADLGIE